MKSKAYGTSFAALMGFCAMVVLTCTVRAEDAEAQKTENKVKPANPEIRRTWGSMKVGDWRQTHFTSPVSMDTLMNDVKIRQTVIANDGKVVKVKEVAKPPSGPAASFIHEYKFEQVIDTNYPTRDSDKVGSGEETVAAAGRQFKCKWAHYRFTMKMGEHAAHSNMKLWLSEDAPFDGLVKLELSVSNYEDGKPVGKSESILILTGFGP